MDVDMIEIFVDKRVCIFLNNGYAYNGFLKKVGSDCILIDDKKNGLMTLRNSDIKNVEMREGGRW